MKNNRIKVGISVGDPNGIGVEVILKTFKSKEMLDFFTPVIFGSTKLMSYQKNIFNLNSMHFQGIFKPEEAIHGKINVVNLWKENVTIEFGKPTAEGAQMAQSSLNAALESLQKGSIDVLVTAPVNTETMQTEEYRFPGNTEFLEETLGGKALIILENEATKIALATHGIPFSDVASKLNKEVIKKQLKALNTTLIQDFCIERPKIAVLGLNPHTGEHGLLEKGDIMNIQSAIKESFDRGILAFGPYSADNFFTDPQYSAFDAILAMHYDQVVVPFKNLTFDYGIIFTSGLPFIRTAPSHGVAYSIAGQNIAQSQSFEQAIFEALSIYKNRKEYLKLKANALQKTKIEGIDIDEDLPLDEEEA